MRRLRPEQRTLLLIGLAVIALTVAAAVAATQSYRGLLLDAFHERSIAYVQAFVSSTRPWLDPVQPDMLHAAAQLLLVGSARYVQLSLDGEFVVDVRATEYSQTSLPEVSSVGSLQSGVRQNRSVGSYLDVVVPLHGEGLGVASYGRIGIDRGSVLDQVRTTTLLVAGLGLLFDVLLLGVLGWAFRNVRSKRKDEDANERRPPVMEAGPLAIDRAGKMVTLHGHPVALTPKQYALLAFLAEHVDSVCSDREILDSVWQDSPYADAKDVKQYIYLIRRRLSKVLPEERNRIMTVPGFGYKLTSGLIDPALIEE